MLIAKLKSDVEKQTGRFYWTESERTVLQN